MLQRDNCTRHHVFVRDVSRGEVRDTSFMKKMEEAQIKRNATVSLDMQWLCNDANLIPSPPFC